MKVINEELNYIKYLFGYQRGKVISEQKITPTLEKDGCEKGFYRDCKKKECIKKPPNAKIVYSQKEYDKKMVLYDYAKKHNSAYNLFFKRLKDFHIKNKTDKNQYKLFMDGNGLINDGPYILGLGLVENEKFYTPNQINQVKFKLRINIARQYRGIDFGDLESRIDGAGSVTQLKKAGHSFTGKYYLFFLGESGDFFSAPQLKEIYPILGCKKESNIPTEKEEPNISTEKEEQLVLSKVTNINDAKSILQIPKNFVLSGSYWCNGKNSLGNTIGDTTVYKSQCENLPNWSDGTKKNYSQYIASWEIKFQPNVAGNANTVPVTRWNIIWNDKNKIDKITSYNFNKVPTDYQTTIKNLFGKPGDDENLTRKRLKEMMYVNSGENDDIWNKFIKPYL